MQALHHKHKYEYRTHSESFLTSLVNARIGTLVGIYYHANNAVYSAKAKPLRGYITFPHFQEISAVSLLQLCNICCRFYHLNSMLQRAAFNSI